MVYMPQIVHFPDNITSTQLKPKEKTWLMFGIDFYDAEMKSRYYLKFS